MTCRKVPGGFVALPFALCLIALASAEPAAAAPCNSPGLLGVVVVCSPGGSETPRPPGKPTPTATASPTGQPLPQPDPGAAAPSGGASTPSPQVIVVPEPMKVPVQVTAGVAVPLPTPAQPPPSAQNSALAAGPRADPGGPARNSPPGALTFSAAGLLLAFGGALIIAGGMVGLRRYPLP